MVSPELLRRFSLFGGFDPAALQELAMIAEETIIGKDEWLFFEGDEADALYLLLKGTVDLKIALNEEGARYADVTMLVPSDLIGWSALVEPHFYTLDAVAATDSRLLKFDANRLRDWMKQNPGLGLELMTRVARVLASRLTHVRMRLVSLIEA
jgi:CRP-like cAMP-binding protein